MATFYTFAAMNDNFINEYFGIGIQNGKTPENLGVLWRTAQNMGASFIFTIGNPMLNKDVIHIMQLNLCLITIMILLRIFNHLPKGARLVGSNLMIVQKI